MDDNQQHPLHHYKNALQAIAELKSSDKQIIILGRKFDNSFLRIFVDKMREQGLNSEEIIAALLDLDANLEDKEFELNDLFI